MVEPVTGSVWVWMWTVVVGGGVGTLAGLFGVGGGFLLVPVLTLQIGIPTEIAVGSATCQVLGPATASLLARGVSREELRLPLVTLGGLLIGVVSGGYLLTVAEQGELPIATQDLVMGIYLILLFALGLFGLWETFRQRRGFPVATGWLSRLQLPPLMVVSGFPRPKISIPTLSWFGLGVGFLSGLLGMSGGLLLVPGLVYLMGQEVHRAGKTSLIIVWMISAIGTVVHAWNGYVSIPLVIALLLGGTVGARIGTGLAKRLGGRQLREGFGWLLLGTAVFILFAKPGANDSTDSGNASRTIEEPATRSVGKG